MILTSRVYLLCSDDKEYLTQHCCWLDYQLWADVDALGCVWAVHCITHQGARIAAWLIQPIIERCWQI